MLDLDVHHGDGIQDILWDEPRALYCSVHCIEPVAGGRFPDAGRPDRVGGAGAARGTNLNVAIEFAGPGGEIGDAELSHALEALVLPVAAEFAPTLALVAMGFDAARGDPCRVGYAATPHFFARATRAVMRVAPATCLVLEGGYKEDALGSCACACVAALLGDDESVRSAAGADAPPPPPLNAAAVAAVKATAAAHRPFWSCLRELARADPGAGGSSE